MLPGIRSCGRRELAAGYRSGRDRWLIFSGTSTIIIIRKVQIPYIVAEI